MINSYTKFHLAMYLRPDLTCYSSIAMHGVNKASPLFINDQVGMQNFNSTRTSLNDWDLNFSKQPYSPLY